MVNQPDQNNVVDQTPTGKLVLPAPPDAGLHRQHYSSPNPAQFIGPGASLQAGPGHGLLTRILQKWRKDPAYAVFTFAIVLVLIASVFLLTLGANALMGGNNNKASNLAQKAGKTLTTGTVDNNPQFGAPGNGNNTDTQNTPVNPPTATPQPGASATAAAATATTIASNNTNPTATTTTNNNGQFTLQITNIPNMVANNSKVRVTVNSSQTNVTVALRVTYNVVPFTYMSGTKTTDGNGNATLTWNVQIVAVNKQMTYTATVTATAIDQQGNIVTSNPVTVTVTG